MGKASLSTGSWESWPGAVHHQTYALAESSAAAYIDAAIAEARMLIERNEPEHVACYVRLPWHRRTERAALAEALAAFVAE